MASMLKIVKIPDLFTIGNLCCGVLALFASFDQLPKISALYILGAMALDSLDGKVAGWLNQKNELGKELDSLADLISFGVAHAFIFYTVWPHDAMITVILLFFVSCGLLRLARYNISDGKGFEGVPITVNGVLFPALVFISSYHEDLLFYWPFIFVIQGFLMISSIKIKRLF